MKPMPRNEDVVDAGFHALGLSSPNPSLEEQRAKLLKYIQNSMKIKRSSNHVSIMLVGPSGVGKSATVNHLLGTKLATTSEAKSETRSTKEFIIHGSYSKYGVENLSLGLVDTPGFCDTDGSKQDACNLLSVKRFFHTHPTLSGCYPNLIFLIMKADDKRFMGKNSILGKSLRCVKSLNLVDPNNPNVVTILTHAGSIRKRTVEEWTKELDEKKTMVSKVVFDDLKVRAPVVVMENKFDDCGLVHSGDFTRLPNGELQPRNLYLACAKVLSKSKDDLGLITLNSIFVGSTIGDRATIPGHETEAKNANKCTLDSEEDTMVQLFEIAEKEGMGVDLIFSMY